MPRSFPQWNAATTCSSVDVKLFLIFRWNFLIILLTNIHMDTDKTVGKFKGLDLIDLSYNVLFSCGMYIHICRNWILNWTCYLFLTLLLYEAKFFNSVLMLALSLQHRERGACWSIFKELGRKKDERRTREKERSFKTIPHCPLN